MTTAANKVERNYAKGFTATESLFLKILVAAKGSKTKEQLLEDCTKAGVNLNSVNSISTTCSHMGKVMEVAGKEAIWLKIKPKAGARGRVAGQPVAVNDEMFADLEEVAENA